MLKNLKKRTEGFTIIEVLIVLAIAGLVLLIVFLAVPALQRNSRNTSRRNDVANYLGAVNEWMANNNGQLPSTAAHLTTAGSGVNALANVTMTEPTAIATQAQTAAVALDTIQLVTDATCTATGDTADATSARAYAVRFSVEDSAGGSIEQCVQG